MLKSPNLRLLTPRLRNAVKTLQAVTTASVRGRRPTSFFRILGHNGGFDWPAKNPDMVKLWVKCGVLALSWSLSLDRQRPIEWPTSANSR